MARVLLVEDDSDIAAMMRSVLERDRHLVSETPSGRQAVLLAESRAWDLVILDLEIEELSGAGVQRAIGDFSAVPVLVMSAGSNDWRKEAFAQGATACLGKPFDVDQLQALVAALVGQPPAAPEQSLALAPMWEAESLSVEDLERLRALGPEEVDALPFGVIQVDERGVIVAFNRYEAAAALLAPERALMRRFIELAPCTKVQRFAGAIERGFAEEHLDEVLHFVFPAFGALAVVTVRLYFDETLRRMWIFVSRSGHAPAARRRDRSGAPDDLGSLV